MVAVLLHLVHKVERYDHRPLQLQKLGGQIEVALNLGGVDDVDDGVGTLPHDEVPGNNLLHGVGGEGVDAGQIHHCDGLAFHLGPALLLLHCHARPVAHVLVGAGEGVEQGGLAAVGVAHQGQLHLPCVVAGVVGHAAVLRRLMGVVGIHPAEGFLVRNVLHHADAPPPCLGAPLPLRAGCHPDLGRVRFAQGQLVPPQVELHRIAERGYLAHRDLGARSQPHIHQPPLHRAVFIANLENNTALARRHLLQGSLVLFRLSSHSRSTQKI